MNPAHLWLPALAGLAPAGVWLAGSRSWAWGLWAGAALAVLNFLWLQRSLRTTLAGTPGNGPGAWWWQSAVRIIMAGGVIVALFRTGQVSLGGLLAGYALTHGGLIATRALVQPKTR